MNRWVAGILMVVLVVGASVPAWAHEGTRGRWTQRQYGPALAWWYVDITASDAAALHGVLTEVSADYGSGGGVLGLFQRWGLAAPVGAASALVYLGAKRLKQCSSDGQHPVRVYGLAFRHPRKYLVEGWEDDGVLDVWEIREGWSDWQYLYAWCSPNE